MSMRALACAASLCVLGFVASAPLVTPPVYAAEAVGQGRQMTSLNDGWRFRFGAEPSDVTAAGFDDSGWETVRVPHSWNQLGEYSVERSKATNNKQGQGWYRLGFDAPTAKAGQRQYLDFAAVGNIADVWVNGVHVGQHKGAYSRFRFDVTAQWKPGARNLIVVRADNTKPEKGSATSEVLPLSGDFFIYGGLYRGVALITTESASIDLMDFGGPGVYASAQNITKESADVTVLTRLRNSAVKTRRLTALTTVRAADGRIVATASTKLSLPSGQSEARQTLKLPEPRLWNGLSDPYLYSVHVELLDGKRVIDQVSQPLGVRSFRVDANEGFFLNGQHIDLVGASRHQDRMGKGYALAPEDHAEDMAIMREMGVNTIRHAHYQHADEWAQEADKAGMMVWAEVPFVSAVSYDGTEGTEATVANAEQQLRELIRQNYNHPSIFTWSVGNEVDAASLFLHLGKPSKALKLLQNLNAIAKAEDPTRLTTFADCCEDTAFATKGAQILTGTTDLAGFNRYYGWYYTAAEDIQKTVGQEFDKLHVKYPTIPIAITEFGAGGALTHHTDNPLGGPINAMGRPHPEEYQNYFHEENWKALKTRKYIYAKWIWNMFDFASDLRMEGEAIDLNDKGLVTFDRKTRKDAFYFYKANWATTPTLHLNSKRYVDRPYAVVDVRVYSNADSVRLSLNGIDKGSAPCPDRICVWPAIALAPGENTAEVSAVINGATVTDKAVWKAPDVLKTGLHLDAGTMSGRVIGGVRYGSDTFFEGGKAVELNNPMMAARGGKVRKVEGSASDLHETWRQGEAFGYRLPLPDGQWQVTIHTFEPSKFSGKDTKVTIRANGKEALKPFNVYTDAGGDMKGLAKTFPVTVTGGLLILDFSAVQGIALVSAIDIRK